MMLPLNVTKFILESNAIEGIIQTHAEMREVDAMYEFLAVANVRVIHLCRLARVFAPEKGNLRIVHGMDVRVGSYEPPKGSPVIEGVLNNILDDHNKHGWPWRTHHRFENLHPFMDGNGRVGRALWLHSMQHNPMVNELGFLRFFYYQTLAEGQVE